jgi:hypothetical protein
MPESAESRQPEPSVKATVSAHYASPRVERVVTAEELEREILYAGGPASPIPKPE